MTDPTAGTCDLGNKTLSCTCRKSMQNLPVARSEAESLQLLSYTGSKLNMWGYETRSVRRCASHFTLPTEQVAPNFTKWWPKRRCSQSVRQISVHFLRQTGLYASLWAYRPSCITAKPAASVVCFGDLQGDWEDVIVSRMSEGSDERSQLCLPEQSNGGTLPTFNRPPWLCRQ